MPMVEYITDDGKEMLAQMLAGKITITFTKIQMGDGTLAIGQSRRTMTHLVNLIKELEVYRVEVTEENVVSIMGIFDNSDMTSGFWFREKGVFASDGINEVLFAYANAGDSAEYINPPTVESVEKQIISLYTNLQSTEKEVNINVISGIYALNEDIEKHTFNTENPHGVTKSQVGLSNVPNVATNDQTPTYTVSTSNAELTSGEKLSVAFGKIAKAVSTLISHISTSATTSVLGHVKYGTTSGTACQGNDSRLSDSRTPKSHASTGTGYGAGTTSNYGHVKLSDSSAVTSSTGLALPATEKNASIEGTLANQISALDTDLNYKVIIDEIVVASATSVSAYIENGNVVIRGIFPTNKTGTSVELLFVPTKYMPRVPVGAHIEIAGSPSDINKVMFAEMEPGSGKAAAWINSALSSVVYFTFVYPLRTS